MESLGRRTGGRQRAGDGVQRRLVAERQLAAAVEELSPRRRLEIPPEGAGSERHLDIGRVWVPEPEDPRVALGARPVVAHGAGSLQDGHAPPALRQRPCGGESEDSGSDNDAAAVVAHGADHTKAPPSRATGGAYPAVRSAAVTIGRAVSTHPWYDTSGTPVQATVPEAFPAIDATPDLDARPGPPEPAADGGTLRAPRAIGFHAAAIAGFALPAVVLWWHVWSGHPSWSLTCSCGDPAQQVWFTAWPAWAMAHLHSPFFSGAVNVPDGANLLSNTAGTLVGVVLAPVTWLWGPVAATNVALTLAPALNAWGCFVAIRPLVRWKAGAIPAALVYGYSSAMVSSLVFGHVSVSVLVIPPLLFSTLHEIVIRQEHSVRRDGLVLAGLLVVQFLISPEVLVMCLLLAVPGLLAVLVVGWRQVRVRAGHALPALGLAAGVAVAVLAYPAWYGQQGPQAVTGVLFALAPLSGVPLSGVLDPGQYATLANAYIRFGGYQGRTGPPADYVGGGVALTALWSVVVGRRRPLTWLLVFMTAVTLALALGPYLQSGPSSLGNVWLPWRDLSKLPVLNEILADQFAPFITLFVAFLLAVGLDALFGAHRGATSWIRPRVSWVSAAATAVVAVVALVPVFVTFDTPFHVVPVRIPAYIRDEAPALPAGTVVLTVPFAVSGSTKPMLWQAVDDMHFRLAGAALKTPNARGGPLGPGPPGSARRILSDLTIAGRSLPTGTPVQLATVRRALREWQVGDVVITGTSRDPVYASGFFTMALGVAPAYVRGAWVWRLQPGGRTAIPAAGASLSRCRAVAASASNRRRPLAMAQCVLFGAGRARLNRGCRARPRRRVRRGRRVGACNRSSTCPSPYGTWTRRATSTCTRSAANRHVRGRTSPMCGSTACRSRCRTGPTRCCRAVGGIAALRGDARSRRVRGDDRSAGGERRRLGRPGRDRRRGSGHRADQGQDRRSQRERD